MYADSMSSPGARSLAEEMDDDIGADKPTNLVADAHASVLDDDVTSATSTPAPASCGRRATAARFGGAR